MEPWEPRGAGQMRSHGPWAVGWISKGAKACRRGPVPMGICKGSCNAPLPGSQQTATSWEISRDQGRPRATIGPALWAGPASGALKSMLHLNCLPLREPPGRVCLRGLAGTQSVMRNTRPTEQRDKGNSLTIKELPPESPQKILWPAIISSFC